MENQINHKPNPITIRSLLLAASKTAMNPKSERRDIAFLVLVSTELLDAGFPMDKDLTDTIEDFPFEFRKKNHQRIAYLLYPSQKDAAASHAP